MDEGGKDRSERRDERDTREAAMLRATTRDSRDPPSRERQAPTRRTERKGRR